jgi:hypothetical protein
MGQTLEKIDNIRNEIENNMANIGNLQSSSLERDSICVGKRRRLWIVIQKVIFDVTPDFCRDVSHIVCLILIQRNIIWGTFIWKDIKAEEIGSNGNISDLYFGGVQFESTTTEVFRFSVSPFSYIYGHHLNYAYTASFQILFNVHESCYWTMYVIWDIGVGKHKYEFLVLILNLYLRVPDVQRDCSRFVVSRCRS